VSRRIVTIFGLLSRINVLQCVAVCCSVLQYVAVCYRVSKTSDISWSSVSKKNTTAPSHITYSSFRGIIAYHRPHTQGTISRHLLFFPRHNLTPPPILFKTPSHTTYSSFLLSSNAKTPSHTTCSSFPGTISRDLLQKRPIIWRSLLVVATTYSSFLPSSNAKTPSHTTCSSFPGTIISYHCQGTQGTIAHHLLFFPNHHLEPTTLLSFFLRMPMHPISYHCQGTQRTIAHHWLFFLRHHLEPPMGWLRWVGALKS